MHFAQVPGLIDNNLDTNHCKLPDLNIIARMWLGLERVVKGMKMFLYLGGYSIDYQDTYNKSLS